jgi:ribose transport system permease protein
MRKFLVDKGVLLALVVLFIVAAASSPDRFLNPENLRNIINQNVSVGLLALGMTFVIILKGIDLSVGSLLALVATFTISALNGRIEGGGPETGAVLVAALTAIGVGTALGLLNGITIVYGRVVPFVATLIGLLAYRSWAQAIASAGEIRAGGEIFGKVATQGIPTGIVLGDRPLLITWGIVLWIAMALVAGFLLNQTRFGRYVIAIGANERAARYSGVPVNRVKLAVYALSGFFTGLGALAISTRMNSVATTSVGQYNELDAIAAVVIGGTNLNGGSGRIWGTVVGVLLLGLINNVLIFYNVSPYLQGVVKGSIILVAVLMQRPSTEEG